MSASASKENKHSLVSVLVVVVMLGTLASLAFIPVETFNAVRESEQAQIKAWLGHETDQWVMLKIFDFLQIANAEADKALESVSLTTGNGKMDAWIIGRVYATLVWSHVVLYRSGLLLMWMAFGIPLMIAVLMDGHYRWRISRTSFSSQSPVLHKKGIDLSKASIAVIVIWLFIPYHITMLVAPLSIAATAFAGWLWIANMQKRM